MEQLESMKKKKARAEEMPEKNRKEIEAIDEELEEEEKELASLTAHGDVAGEVEYAHVEKTHPLLKTLFIYADVVLDLSKEEADKLYLEYQKPFLKGELVGDQEKFKKFEEEYAHPFYAEFFSRVYETLKLNYQEKQKLEELEELHGERKLVLGEKEELARYIERFCRTLEAEKDKKEQAK